jgi:hypothetical protein
MIDREQPKRAEKSEVQASDRRCGWPSGLLPAVGGLPHPAKRRIIGVREPPYGKCRMRTWFYEGAPPRAPEHTAVGGSVFNFTPSYMEMITPCTDYIRPATASTPDMQGDNHFVIHFFQLDERRWMVCTCWGHHFDFFEHMLTYRDTSAGAWRAVRESCPTFNVLFQRKDEPFNYDAALFQANDPDSNDVVWLLGGFFGNVNITHISHFFEGYPREVFYRVLDLSLKLGGETLNGPMAIPNLARYIGAEAQKEEFRAMVRAAPKVFKEIANLGRLLGG